MDQPAACRRGSPPRLSIVFACSTRCALPHNTLCHTHSSFVCVCFVYVWCNRCRVTVRSVSRAGTLSPRPDPSIVGFCERQLPAHAHARGGCNRAKTVRTIAANTGIAGLWRGSGAALLRVVPSSGEPVQTRAWPVDSSPQSLLLFAVACASSRLILLLVLCIYFLFCFIFIFVLVFFVFCLFLLFFFLF